jgi:hypothetical protein
MHLVSAISIDQIETEIMLKAREKIYCSSTSGAQALAWKRNDQNINAKTTEKRCKEMQDN